MAQMAFTCRAAHFGSNHAMADIPVLLHRILFDRSGETGPAGARIELRVAGEKHRAAARAAVYALVVVLPVFAGEGRLGPRLALHLILSEVKLLAPLRISLVDLPHGMTVGSWPRGCNRNLRLTG